MSSRSLAQKAVKSRTSSTSSVDNLWLLWTMERNWSAGAGDAVSIPPGHDAWVVGEEPVVAVDFGGMETYGLAGGG